MSFPQKNSSAEWKPQFRLANHAVLRNNSSTSMYITALRRCLVQCLGVLMGAFLFVSGAWGQLAPLAMRAPALPSGAVDLGAAPGSQPLRLTLYLAPPADRTAALVSFLTAVQTPGSASYKQWLTPEEFGQQFGPTADQIAAVSAFAQASGLKVESASASGLRVEVSGTVAQVEAAMEPGLHAVQVGAKAYYANTAAPVLPAAVAGSLLAVGGLNDVPSVAPLSMATDGAAVGATPVKDALRALSAAVEENAARLISLSTASCLEDVDAASRAAMQLALRQASAQGIIVLAQTGCGSRGSAGFPSVLSEATSVAIAPGITPPAVANLTELRPWWQLAQGLPADGFRHEPDVTASGLDALAATMMSILATEPAGAGGSSARLGNVNATLYELASEPGLYTQADGAVGTWEAATGLGLVDLQKLFQFFPRGSLSDNVSIAVSNGGYVTHGSSLTFSSTVTDTSGQGGGVVPTGGVVFSTSTGVALGTGTLSGGSASVSNNALPGGTYSATAAYSGDGTYGANTSVTAGFTVGPEAAQVTAIASNAVVGGTSSVVITVKSLSGVGTPSGAVTVIPQGTSDTTTYTGTLSGSGATATATVTVDAVQGGADVFKANCTTGTTFTCFSPVNVTAQVGAGTPSMSLSVSPASPTAGQTATFSTTVRGGGGKYPTPTGNIAFYDSGTQLGSATLNNGSATYTTANIPNTATHSFTAIYGGDNNYVTVTAAAGATAASATTTALMVNPNPPVSGSTTTLTAAITYTLTNSTAPAGTVSFYEDGVLLGTGTVSGGTATFVSTTLSGTASHAFYAVYGGNANYLTSTSTTVTTPASGTTGTVATTVSVTASPSMPVSGSTTTLSALIGYTLNNAAPTGTMAFYQDGTLLGTVALSGAGAMFTSTTLSSTAPHEYTAVYSGDANYAASTSPGLYTSASTATNPTTTTLTILPTQPASGSTTTLTATIGFTNNGLTYPQGNVTFYQDGTAIGVVAETNVTNDVATFTSTTLSSTTAHTYYAVYGGNAYFETSTSSLVTTSASTATVPTTVSLTISPNPPVNGSTTTATATVASSVSGTNPPSGTVTFYEDSAALASAALSGAGTAVLTSTTLSSKTAHTFYAVYSGDGTFKTSTSTTTTTPAASTGTEPTTTTVSASSPTATSGGTVTVSATVTPSAAVNGTALTGTVTFTSATQGTLCSGAVSGGTASCVATLTTAGVQSINATYAGDTNYAGSTSTAAATVTVAGATGALTAAASPSSTTYGGTVMLSSTLSATTAVTGDPAGTVTFALAGTVAASYTATLVGSSTTASIATQAIVTPVPGTYTVTTTCASANVTCTGLTGTASLTVTKGNTTTMLTASPTSPLAGQTTVLTATVAPATTLNAAALAPTGTVMFFINGTSTTEALVNGVATFATVLTATTGNFVTAVYSGDTNWNGSTSAQLIVDIAPIVTTSSLSANETNALYTANVVLSDTVLAPSTATNASPASPGGTVTFYDLYNGQTILLGNANLTPLIPGQSVAQLSTTGLMKGTHNITALYSANTTFAASTGTIVINITDYGVTYSPSFLTPAPGAGGSSIATVTAFNGFAGQVVLGCTPPAGALMTCSFSPTVITGSGTAVLSVTTTAATATMVRPARMGKAASEITLAAVSLGTLLLGLLLPGTRRRPTMLIALLAAMVLGVSMGCTTQGTAVTSGSPTGGTGGTPQGTQLLSITTSGTDGVTTERHDVQFPVTVQ